MTAAEVPGAQKLLDGDSSRETSERRASARSGSSDQARPGRAIVEVKNLSKLYEPSPLWMRFLLRSAITSPVLALDDVSLTLESGTICAVVGPNGAGKSTLFRILTGLTTPTMGSVEIDGMEVEANLLAARRMIGFVPSGDQTLYLRMSCVENLRFHGRLQGLPERSLNDRIQVTLEQVGLGGVGDRVGFALSAGMRARLLLARATLHSPRLLVLDEPTAAVDPVGSHELLATIQRVVRESGVSVLLSSHRLEEIEALQDQVALLHRGRLLYKGSLDAFRREVSRSHLRLTFVDGDAVLSAESTIARMNDASVVRRDGCSLEVATNLPLWSLARRLGATTLARLHDATTENMPLRDLLAEALSDKRESAP